MAWTSMLFLLYYFFFNFQAREKPNKHPKIFIMESDIGNNLFRTQRQVRQVRLHISVQRNCKHTKWFSLMLALAMQVQKKKKRSFLPHTSGKKSGVFPSFKTGAHRKVRMSIPQFWWEQILHSSDKRKCRLPGYILSPAIQVINERK